MICARLRLPLQPFSDLSRPSDQPINVHPVPLWLAWKLELFGWPFQLKGPLPVLLSLFMHSYSFHLQQFSATHMHTHKCSTLHLKHPIFHLPFLLLKGNMMRLIDHYVVNHSKFVVAFSCISLCPHYGLCVLQLLFSSCSYSLVIQMPPLYFFVFFILLFTVAYICLSFFHIS